MNHSEISLRLINVLLKLYDIGSVTGVAADLGISQPQVSNELQKLRAIYKDPLFERKSNRMIATERCDQIVSKLRHVDDAIESTLSLSGSSSPISKFYSDEWEFNICFDDHALSSLMPRLVDFMYTVNENLKLRFSCVEYTTTRTCIDLLKTNVIDIVVSSEQLKDSGLSNEPLYFDQWLLVGLEDECFDKSDRRLVFCTGTPGLGLDIKTLGYPGSVEVPNFVSVTNMIAKSGNDGILPRSVYEEYRNQFCLAIRQKFPLESPLYLISNINDISEKRRFLYFSLKQIIEKLNFEPLSVGPNKVQVKEILEA